MPKLQKTLFLCCMLFVYCANAQYTEVINSNRPGFSESPYSVGSGAYQLESSFFFRKTGIYPTFSRPKSSGLDLLFRSSFFKEKLELNVNITYQKEEIAFENIFTSSYFTNGLSRFTIGGKYLLYEQTYQDKSKEIRSWVKRHQFDSKRLIPTVAVYVGLNTDFVGDIHKINQMTPKVGVLLQNDLTNKFNIVTNIFYDKIGSNATETSYIITGTYSLNDRWSTFFENQTIFTKLRVSSNIGSGLAFLFNRNLQVNSSLRLIEEGNESGFYTSIGVSYRFDKHVDKVIQKGADGLDEQIISLGPEKKGLFGRLFDKIAGIFKKKNKKTIASDVKLSTQTVKSILKNSNKNSTLNKNDAKKIRTRTKRVRVKPSKIKLLKEKRKKKGLLGRLFGWKSDKKNKKDTEKSIDKELKKLEKKQKKLEKQQRKEEARKKREEAKKKKK